MPKLRVALAQINPRLGDLSFNSALIRAFVSDAHLTGADLIAFPEMALTGYPIEDLARRPDFLRSTRSALDSLAANLSADSLGHIPVIVGLPTGPVSAAPHAPNPHAIAHNSAAVLQNGRVIGIYHKQHLPNYSVFDEYRNFVPGDATCIVHVAGVDVGLLICEDVWRDHGPIEQLKSAHPGTVIVINGSPFERDKDDVRIPLIARRAQEFDAPIAYVNLVGGQDDLVFDGDSFIVSAGGKVVARAGQFQEHLLVAELDVRANRFFDRGAVNRLTLIETDPVVHETAWATSAQQQISVEQPALKQIWDALVLGLRDYVDKNGFPGVVLGMSGGIDSAVCAALAVDALGSERVLGISMPSRYSSEHSRSDAYDSCERLGIEVRTEPIADLVAPVETQLHLDGLSAENLQARIRGLILMSVSNAEGHLVLSTGNKTEIAVGYSTIYGDSVGGFAPIKDVPKMLVWELARWRNDVALGRGVTPPIPPNSITKPPSAELRPGQTDQDSLPPYDVLDAILEGYIVQHLSLEELVNKGFDRETVTHIIALVKRAEWKRRQGAIGPKISEMAFGRDRRLPITNAT